jgi:PASTA domain
VIGSQIHLTGAGSCTVTASQPGNADYFPAAANVSQTFTIHKATQTISFGPLAAKRVGDPDFVLGASASSGLPVAFTASGRCTVSGATLHLTGAGSCFVTAKQAGDANWNRAADVSQLFTIGRTDQTIAFAPLANRALGTTDFAVSARASSGLSVSFSATGQCRMSAVARVHLTGVGTCTVRAAQGGDANYNAAAPVSHAFQVTGAAAQPRPKAKTCKVPRVLGKRLAAARKLIKQRGCRTGNVRYAFSRVRVRGIVLGQSRRAGAVVPAGTRINLRLSRGHRR